MRRYERLNESQMVAKGKAFCNKLLREARARIQEAEEDVELISKMKQLMDAMPVDVLLEFQEILNNQMEDAVLGKYDEKEAANEIMNFLAAHMDDDWAKEPINEE